MLRPYPRFPARYFLIFMLVPLTLADPRVPALARTNEPVTVGVPLPRGMAATTEAWHLETSGGTASPLQVRPLDRWADGSIRWALLDFRAFTNGVTAEPMSLHLAGGHPVAPPSDSVSVRKTEAGLSVETAAASFTLSKHAPLFFTSVRAHGEPVIEASASALRVVDAAGEACKVAWQEPLVEDSGIMRATVCVHGEVHGPRVHLHLVARLHFHAGSPVVRLQLTVRNPKPAEHPDGFWELGDGGSVLLKELAVVLVPTWTTPIQRIICSVEPGDPLRVARNRIEVYQESSGGENWASGNHVNRNGVVPLRFSGYWIDVDEDVVGGQRATPIVLLEGRGTVLGGMFPAFWQNFPRAIEASRDAIAFGLFPREHGDLHELQGGEQKTHELYLVFGNDHVTDLPLDWCRDRLVAHPSPDWYGSSEVVPYLTPAAGRAGGAREPGTAVSADGGVAAVGSGAPGGAEGAGGAGAAEGRLRLAEDEELARAEPIVQLPGDQALAAMSGDYDALVNAAIEGADTFIQKRERIDEYGWRHFGEIYGDHEAMFPVAETPGPLVSHYNNQYDAVAGFTYQFLRIGRRALVAAGRRTCRPCRRHRHLPHRRRTSRPTTTACSGTPSTTSTPARRRTGPTRGRRDRTAADRRPSTTTPPA